MSDCCWSTSSGCSGNKSSDKQPQKSGWIINIIAWINWTQRRTCDLETCPLVCSTWSVDPVKPLLRTSTEALAEEKNLPDPKQPNPNPLWSGPVGPVGPPSKSSCQVFLQFMLKRRRGGATRANLAWRWWKQLPNPSHRWYAPELQVKVQQVLCVSKVTWIWCCSQIWKLPNHNSHGCCLLSSVLILLLKSLHPRITSQIRGCKFASSESKARRWGACTRGSCTVPAHHLRPCYRARAPSLHMIPHKPSQ